MGDDDDGDGPGYGKEDEGAGEARTVAARRTRMRKSHMWGQWGSGPVGDDSMIGKG